MTPPKILNLDVPRAFTTTVKSFDFRSSCELKSIGIDYDSIDLNLCFWQFAFQFSDSPITLDSFITANLKLENIHQFLSAQDNIRNKYGLELNPNGYFLQTSLTRAADIDEAIKAANLRGFVEDYTAHFVDRFDLHENRFNAISINCTSIATLIIACAIVRALREKLNYQPKFILIGQGYENFSLRFRQADIERNGHLLNHFDAVAYDEETSFVILANQCGLALPPVAIKPTREVMGSMLEGSLYLKSMIMAPSHCPVFLRLSRNPCYWRRCNFCVQNDKHSAGVPFLESAEIDVALMEIEIMHSHGFRFFIFSDEAVSPASVKKLIQYLKEASKKTC